MSPGAGSGPVPTREEWEEIERRRRREQDDKCKHAEQRSVEREEAMETIAPDSLTGITNRITEAQEKLRAERKAWEEREEGLKAELELVREVRVHLIAGTPPADRLLATHVVNVSWTTDQAKPQPEKHDLTAIITLDAIKDVAAGAPRLRERYFGRKFYEAFDQREDHKYGFGPKHGTIVFRIGLTQAVLDRLEEGGELTQEERDAVILYLTKLPKVGVA